MLSRTAAEHAASKEPGKAIQSAIAHPDAHPSAVAPVLGAVVTAIEQAGIPYVLLGGLASAVLGRGRHSTDIDLLVKPEDAEATVTALSDAGFATERTNPHWIYKGFKDEVLVDIIFKAKGDIYLDEDMLARARTLAFHGQPVRVIPPEDLIVIKAIIHDEETPRHWYDALGVLAGSAIDWDYLLARAKKNPTRIMSLLLYAESIGLVVPPATLQSLATMIFPLDGGRS
jgi:predicted nucleotidyltransferase